MSLGIGSYDYSKIRSTISVGNYSSIAKDCIFMRGDENHLCIQNKKCVYTNNMDQLELPGKPEIEIGNDVWICEGARILPGIKIGDGVIIGAGAVVTKNVPPFAIVVGNPGVITRFRFSQEQIDKLRQIKWWDWEPEIVEKRKEDLKDIDKFLEKYDKTA